MIKALNQQEPDRVPIDMGSFVTSITAGAHERLKEYLGISGGEEISDRTQMLVYPCEEILKRLKVDIRYLHLKPPSGWKDKEMKEGVYEDEFGVRRRKVGYYYDIIYSPLSSIKSVRELDRYKWLDPRDPSRFEGLEQQAKDLYENTPYAISNANTEMGSIFEYSWYERGFENFLADLSLNRSLAEAILDRWLEFRTAMMEEFLNRVGSYLQVVNVGDDLSSQNSLLISADLYRKIVKPRQRELFQFIKTKTKAKLFYHACGAIYPLIEGLIEIGVDILHPIQP